MRRIFIHFNNPKLSNNMSMSNETDSNIINKVIDLSKSPPPAMATRDNSFADLLSPGKLAGSQHLGQLAGSPDNNNKTNNVDDVVMSTTMNPDELAAQGTELKSTLKGPMTLVIQKYVAAQEALKEVLDKAYRQCQRYMSECKKSNVQPDQEISVFVNDWSDLFNEVSL